MAKIDPEILDRCLRRIQTGQATADECLAENPTQATLLEPLLHVAVATRSQLTVSGPSETFLTHSPKRVMNVVRARLKESTPTKQRSFAWIGQPAYRLAGVLLALVLLIGSVGVAYASEDALPGDSLYGVKLGLERAALAVNLSPEVDAELLVEHANRRIAEVEELMRRGRDADIGPALENYGQAIQRGLEIASEHGASLEDLGAALGEHEQVLASVLVSAPEQAIPGLTRALENSRNGMNEVEQIRSSGQHPSDLAPGQLKKTPEPSEVETEQPSGQQNQGQSQGRDQAPGQLKKSQTPDSDGSD